jgi:LPXTG-motif cell wall-anchored protein
VNAAGTELRFTTPRCAVGLASIVVTTAGGSSDPLAFRYTAAAAAGAGNGAGTLANTGTDAAPVLGTGLGLLLLGLLAASVMRIRKRTV